jgi:hypothetical protein
VLAYSITYPFIAKLKDHPAYLTYLKKEKSLSLRSFSSTSEAPFENSPEFMASLGSTCDSVKIRMEEKLEEEMKEKMQEITEQRDRYKRELERMQQEIEDRKEGKYLVLMLCFRGEEN